MPKIIKYNCNGMCSEAYCNKSYTHFHILKIKNMKIFIPFCKKHADEFEEELFELYEMKKKMEVLK